MVRSNGWLLRAMALGVAAVLTLAACGWGEPLAVSRRGSPTGRAPLRRRPGTKGGTIYILTQAEGWNQVDPQRVYTGEDLAFFGGTIHAVARRRTSSRRTRLRERRSPRTWRPTSVRPRDGGKTWSFTLRDGVTWQDGSDDHLRGRQVRRLPHVRDRRHQPGPDLRDRVPRHPATTMPIGRAPRRTRAPTRQGRPGALRQGRRLRRQDDHVPPEQAGRGLQLHHHARLLAGPRGRRHRRDLRDRGPVRHRPPAPTRSRATPPATVARWSSSGTTNWDQASDPLPPGLSRQVGGRLRDRPEGHRPADHPELGQ